VKYTAAWCKKCGEPVWLPHHQHRDDILVEYDGGKPQILSFKTPAPPTLAEIKKYRNDLAEQEFSHGDCGKAIAILEDLLGFVDRQEATPEEIGVDHVILANLAECLLVKGEPGKALAVLDRAPLRLRTLDDGLRRCLGLRALCYAALGIDSKARGDRDRLYAQDPKHPMLGKIEEAIH
jgi:hypothetical protein